MSSLNGQELEIFRAGNYGAKGVYTAADLQQLASEYNPTQHEAPLVIGHPKTEDRAYGWFKSLRAQGDVLFGTPQQVPDPVSKAVEEGAYKKRSVAITRKPDGKLMLRHVGLLGAMVPGVLGMADAKFGEEAFEEFEFNSDPGESDMSVEAQQQERNAFMDRLMKFFSGDPKGTQTIDVEKLKTELAVAGDAKLTALQTEFSDYKAKHEKATQAGAAKDLVAKLKADGKWLPAFDRMGVPELFAAVAEGSTEEFEFADSKGTKKKQDPLQALGSIIGSVARFVPRGATFGDEQPAVAIIAPVAPEVPEGTSVDPASVRFNEEVVARMKDKGITYAAALSQLTSEGKSAASYSTANVGAV